MGSAGCSRRASHFPKCRQSFCAGFSLGIRIARGCTAMIARSSALTARRERHRASNEGRPLEHARADDLREAGLYGLENRGVALLERISRVAIATARGCHVPRAECRGRCPIVFGSRAARHRGAQRVRVGRLPLTPIAVGTGTPRGRGDRVAARSRMIRARPALRSPQDTSRTAASNQGRPNRSATPRLRSLDTRTIAASALPDGGRTSPHDPVLGSDA